ERLDDDQLARLAEEERVDAGLDAYDPDEVPPATDEPPEPDLADSEVFQEARAEIRREYDKDELTLEHERSPYPPTPYHSGATRARRRGAGQHGWPAAPGPRRNRGHHPADPR